MKNDNPKQLNSLAAPIENFTFRTLLSNAQRTEAKYFFWAKPSDDYYAFGFDSLLQLKNFDKQYNNHEPSTIDELKNNFINNWDEINLKTVPIVMGSRKFQDEIDKSVWEDYPNSDWFIPKIIFFSTNNKHFLILNYFYDNALNTEQLENIVLSLLTETTAEASGIEVTFSNNNDNRGHDQWVFSVGAALSDIAGGKLNKIVLSREVTTQFNSNPNLSFLIEKLRSKYPECYIFAFRSGESIFFGASPEKLINVTNNHFESDALAGSIKRGISKTEDDSLAYSLLNSDKNIAEQKAVVDFIVSAASKFANSISYDKSPRIKKLENIQHLWTPISGTLKENVSMLDIIDALHPTPAVCGVPCKDALKFINLHEKHKRGLYSGAIGWFNFNNEAEFAVGIRSALIKGNKFYAYSGCGIVEGSTPESEYEESELKLKPILTLFKNENSN